MNFALLNESYLHFELKVNSVTPNGAVLTFCKNFIPFLFSEIRLEMNGILIDSIKSPGVSLSMMKYITENENEKISSTRANGKERLKKTR